MGGAGLNYNLFEEFTPVSRQRDPRTICYAHRPPVFRIYLTIYIQLGQEKDKDYLGFFPTRKARGAANTISYYYAKCYKMRVRVLGRTQIFGWSLFPFCSQFLRHMHDYFVRLVIRDETS